MFRTTRFLRLNIRQADERKISSICRLREMHRIGLPHSIQDVSNLLSDQSDPDYPVHRQGTSKDCGYTIATGLFNFKQLKWIIHIGKPNATSPIAIIPLDI